MSKPSAVRSRNVSCRPGHRIGTLVLIASAVVLIVGLFVLSQMSSPSSAPRWSVVIQPERLYVSPGEEIVVRALVSPALTSVRLEWSADSGILQGTGERVRWRAGSSAGIATIWVTAEHAGQRRIAGIRITAWRPAHSNRIAHTPSSSGPADLDVEVAATKTEICRGEQAFLTAHAANAVSDQEIYYRWEILSGPTADIGLARLGAAREFAPAADAPAGTYVWRVVASPDVAALGALDDVAPTRVPSKTLAVRVLDCVKSSPLAVTWQRRYLFDHVFQVFDAQARSTDPDSSRNPEDYEDTPTLRSVRSFEWDFGDGSPRVQTPVGSAAHTFGPLPDGQTRATYTVTVRMTFASGRTEQARTLVPLELFDPEREECAFEYSLRSMQPNEDGSWKILIELHNVSPFQSGITEARLVYPRAPDAPLRTLDAQALVDASEIEPGGLGWVELRLAPADLAEGDAVFADFHAEAGQGGDCSTGLWLTRFEATIYSLADEPDFAEQDGLEAMSDEAKTKRARWRAAREALERRSNPQVGVNGGLGIAP